MGPIWGRQDPGGPHVGPMNFVIWVIACSDLRRVRGPAKPQVDALENLFQIMVRI